MTSFESISDLVFEPEANKLSIKGRALSLSNNDPFHKLQSWLIDFEQAPENFATLVIDLQTMNGNSIRSLLQTIRFFQKLKGKGKTVFINWIIPQGEEDLEDLSRYFVDQISMPYTLSAQ